ncbi:MAG: DNA-directed DNA polymerase [Candidatus Pacearchaeota archaeon]
MVLTTFIPIDYDYFDFNEKNYVKIIGRSVEGKRVCILDTCDIYLWAILEEGLTQKEINAIIENIKKIKIELKEKKIKIDKVEVYDKKFLGKPVKALKIFVTNYRDLKDVAENLTFPGIKLVRGYDLGFITHYINERKISPLYWYEISGKIPNPNFFDIKKLDVDQCIEASTIRKIEEKKFLPKVLCYDIETDDIKVGMGEILMISLVGDNFRKVITWKKQNKNEEYVEIVKDEPELLKKFCEYVRKISPDFLVGYFSDGFDLPYLKARADYYKMKLPLGLNDSPPKFSKGISLAGKIFGIVHIDLLKFIRTAYSQYMQSETLSLNEVAKEFLGESKKEFKIEHSSRIEDHHWSKYYEYNLQDSLLTFKLFEKMWPDILEFTRIMQEPVFDVTRNGMSSNVEDYIIHNLDRFNEIPERKPTHEEVSQRIKLEKYEGAFVFEPIPGIYEDLAVFDFTSSYGTTIVTYNLSKSTYIEKPKKGEETNSIEALGRTLYFSKIPGFFPEMLKEIIEKRKQYKKELKEKSDVMKQAKSNAFKLLANASYGYQGFSGARYYCREAAAATAAFARKLIKEIIEKINNAGYKVIYSDTDSIVFSLNKKSESDTLKLLKKLNSELPGIMELELEGFFKRGIWVTKRAGVIGAKKKYALLRKDGKIKIRGFETVRRDWCLLAREVQNKVIRQILEDGDEKKSLLYVKEIIKKIKERDVPLDKLIIRTVLQKPITEYKAISPHVIAARKMQEREMPISAGNLIEYYISESKDNEKKKLIRERVKLPDEVGEYDTDYYIYHQILPAVENIFQIFNTNIKDILDEKKQTKLEDF